MINLRFAQSVKYFGEQCTVIDVYGSYYVLQSIKNPDVTYEVNKTSRFLEADNGYKKHLQKTALVTR